LFRVRTGRMINFLPEIFDQLAQVYQNTPF
jgi:hypothetical protein